MQSGCYFLKGKNYTTENVISLVGKKKKAFIPSYIS